MSLAMGGITAALVLLILFSLLQKWVFGKLGSWKSFKWRMYFALSVS